MPNFKALSLDKISYPYQKNNISFEWSVKSDNENESLILCKFDEFSFFIKQIEKNNAFLVKGEKYTRFFDAQILKETLIEFANATNANIIYSNIYSKNKPIFAKYSYIKPIDFFINKSFSQEIWLEIGFGSGRHLLHLAKQNPQILFIGVEIHKPSLTQVSKRLQAENLENVILVEFDARVLMEILPSNSIGKIFVHFPVPWDKKPHRRVISDEFFQESIRLLKENATLEVRTDSENYYEFCVNVFLKQQKSDIHIKKNQNLQISSKYEDRWKKLEKNIYDIIFKNYENSENLAKINFLEFDILVDSDILVSNFKPFNKVESNWFLHIEKFYNSDDILVIKASFGAVYKPENRFLIIRNSKVSFFPNKVLATKANIESFKALKEWLNLCKKQ